MFTSMKKIPGCSFLTLIVTQVQSHFTQLPTSSSEALKSTENNIPRHISTEQSIQPSDFHLFCPRELVKHSGEEVLSEIDFLSHWRQGTSNDGDPKNTYLQDSAPSLQTPSDGHVHYGSNGSILYFTITGPFQYSKVSSYFCLLYQYYNQCVSHQAWYSIGHFLWLQIAIYCKGLSFINHEVNSREPFCGQETLISSHRCFYQHPG
ncbi:hypothetical protein PGT21_017550 [Puccinia graminis f. sp. tritici]|uniref:Uncharacterized protein n=1 Tax=Puccinia graminis f. sp. tritici TaxID=56615 RepID=A0A5B0MXB2_PUCGR|nr:hypothetical protein PGT21_017550 [Puccinia graminis f. sp. tritici]